MGWTTDAIPSLDGRLALVTGANIGLGLETVRALASKGATVVMACRSSSKANAARSKLLDEGLNGLDLVDLDLADLDSVDAAAEVVRQRYGQLDLLVNNAGVMAPPYRRSRQGHELQFAVNHLGHMALTLSLLPLLQKRCGARVVTVTSGAQYFGRIRWDDLAWEQRYDRFGAYSQSKLANVMFALELDDRMRKQGKDVLSLAAHPGMARTNLQRSNLTEQSSRLEHFAVRALDPLLQSAAMGALPQLHAATANTAQGGEHYGPDQLGGLRGYPRRCRVAAAALDPDERQRLWQVSESLINRTDRLV